MIDYQQTIQSEYINSPRFVAMLGDWNSDIDPRYDFRDFIGNVWNVYGAGGSHTSPVQVVSYTPEGPVFSTASTPTLSSVDPLSAVSYGLDLWGRRVGANRNISVATTSTTYFGFSNNGAYLGWQPFGNDASSWPPGVGGLSPFWPNGPFTTNTQLANKDFLTLILTKAMSNISNCSAPVVTKLLQMLFGPGAYAQDLGNMQAAYFVPSLSAAQLSILQHSGALNRPAGVQVFIITLGDPATTFGFSNNGVQLGWQPFGEGTFQNIATYPVVS